MKVSREERARVRQQILNAAETEWARNGYYQTRIKDVAARAKVPQPTLYKHFATREKLAFDLIRARLEGAIDRFNAIPGLEAFTFREKLQALIETQFDTYSHCRELLRTMGPSLALLSLGPYFADFLATKRVFTDAVGDLLEGAVAAEEFPRPAFESMVLELLWELDVGMLHYWANDDSEQHTRTTQFLDKCLDVVGEMMRGSLLAKVADLARFLVRQQFQLQAVRDRRGIPEGDRAGRENAPKKPPTVGSRRRTTRSAP